MFRKKQTPTNQPGRNVRPQQTANVFSYRTSRSTTSGTTERRMEQQSTARKQRVGRDWLSFLPSFVAGCVLLICLGYISSLSTDAKLLVVGDQRELGLTTGIETYEAGVQEIFSDSIKNQSKLLIDTDEIAEQLSDKYPELGEIAVVLPLVGRRPVVQVQPAKPALVLGTSQGGFVIDENGRIIADAADIDSSVRDGFPALQDESGLQLERGKYALNSQAVTLVGEVARQLKNKDIKVQSMILPTTPNELHVRIMDKPYFVKFNLRGDGRVQVGTFIATKEKLEADNITSKQYIDVRVPGKVYYK